MTSGTILLITVIILRNSLALLIRAFSIFKCIVYREILWWLFFCGVVALDGVAVVAVAVFVVVAVVVVVGDDDDAVLLFPFLFSLNIFIPNSILIFILYYIIFY